MVRRSPSSRSHGPPADFSSTPAKAPSSPALPSWSATWDEGEYWETRDDDVLLKALRRSSQALAALAGKLRDEGLEVEAPIFEHPRFEHLEMGEDE